MPPRTQPDEPRRPLDVAVGHRWGCTYTCSLQSTPQIRVKRLHFYGAAARPCTGYPRLIRDRHDRSAAARCTSRRYWSASKTISAISSGIPPGGSFSSVGVDVDARDVPGVLPDDAAVSFDDDRSGTPTPGFTALASIYRDPPGWVSRKGRRPGRGRLTVGPGVDEGVKSSPRHLQQGIS
jgi:hypothetical protein